MKIVIWTGAAWEPWGPSSVVSGGIGGSETAAIMMSFELTKLGHDVVMIGEHTTEGAFGTLDSSNKEHFVTYVNYTRALADKTLLDCDVLISSRDKNIIRLNNQARLKVLWIHDVNCGDDWERDLPSFDILFTLSNWAKEIFLSYYSESRYLLEPKTIVTRNGIDIEKYKDFIPPESRPPHFVYSSSPDRGLDLLLDLWPKIKAFAPEAELRVYYGFDTWKKMAERRKSKSTLMQIGWFTQRLLDMGKQGVYYVGRVGQEELATAQRNSALWLYPTAFPETSCISAMEAQAAGAVPVTTRYAALAETVKHGILIPAPSSAPAYQAEFLRQVESLLGPEKEERIERAIAGHEYAMENLSWEIVAREWDELFRERLA